MSRAGLELFHDLSCYLSGDIKRHFTLLGFPKSFPTLIFWSQSRVQHRVREIKPHFIPFSIYPIFILIFSVTRFSPIYLARPIALSLFECTAELLFMLPAKRLLPSCTITLSGNVIAIFYTKFYSRMAEILLCAILHGVT
jgi:hypothetical protein